MITLRQDGWRKVLKGMTTIDEVARVTAGDIIVEWQDITGALQIRSSLNERLAANATVSLP